MISISCAMSIEDRPETEANLSLPYEECNPLRYIAGYVCAKTEKKIKSSTHSFCDDIPYVLWTSRLIGSMLSTDGALQSHLNGVLWTAM